MIELPAETAQFSRQAGILQAEEGRRQGNCGGQDKSDGPVGVYAVVKVVFFAGFRHEYGAAGGLKSLLCLVRDGTTYRAL